MARLTSPKGVTVEVSDQKADTLRALGYSAEKAEDKAPAKKAASSRKSASVDSE